MFIHEAISRITAEEPYISREAWLYRGIEHAEVIIRILPTNTPDCCVIESDSSRRPCRGWEPTADDLLAADWFVVRSSRNKEDKVARLDLEDRNHEQ